MTTVAYCSVSEDGRTYGHQMFMRGSIVPDLMKLTQAAHEAGSKASIQLGHCGYFASKSVIGKNPIGPSRMFNTYGLSYCSAMDANEIGRVIFDFAKAALLARECGFDAVEIHAGHGYLLSQFISPYTNRRKDEWGGSIENRMRFPAAVIHEIRTMIGNDFPVIVKMNLSDGFDSGLKIEEACEVAERFESEGSDALELSCGFVSKTPLYMLRGNVPLKEMVSVQDSWIRKMGLSMFGRIFVQTYPFEEMFLLEDAKKVRQRVKLPLILLGGIRSLDNINRAMDEGFDFVAMGRALIHDPDLVNKMMAGTATESECDQCNKCIAEMDRGGVRCVLLDEEEA